MKSIIIFIFGIFFIDQLSTVYTIECGEFVNKTLINENNQNDDDRWFGVMNFQAQYQISSVIVEFKFDNPVERVISNFGDFIRINSLEFRLSKPKLVIWRYQFLQIPFTVNYNSLSSKIPNLIEILFNNREICKTDSYNYDLERFLTTQTIPTRRNNFNIQPTQPMNRSIVTKRVFPTINYPECDDKSLIDYHFNSTLVGRYSVTLKLDPSKIKEHSILDITFDKSIYIIGTLKSSSSTRDSTKFSIYLSETVDRRSNLFLFKFFIKYNDLERRPKIINIQLDKQILCNSKSQFSTSRPIQHTTKSTFRKTTEHPPITSLQTTPLPTSLSPEKFFEWLLQTPPENDIPDENVLPKNCLNEIIGSRIGGGSEASPGQFPWHAAIYSKKNKDYMYDCGGTLISLKTIVTAGHCVTPVFRKKPFPSEIFLVYLGLFSLRREIGGEQVRKVYKIIVHPEYEPEGVTYYSDVAIMKLSELIEITPTVSPICLWDKNDDISLLVNKKGIIPGWGMNEHGVISVNLTYIEMPVISRSTCLKKNPDFYSRLLTGRSYCAGKGNGESVCNGDSGGGMVFINKQEWRLRGIVSVGLKRENENTCDLQYYPVFTDVAHFIPWITQNSI